jgi:hypothetical protein
MPCRLESPPLGEERSGVLWERVGDSGSSDEERDIEEGHDAEAR